jgi:hypothetical protein
VTRPQKSIVEKANVNALGDMAKPLRESADKLAESAARVHDTVYAFDWDGLAKNAADGRADRELTQDRTVAADLHTLADAYENGKNTMQPMIDGLKSTARGLEGDNFSVSEDWVVKDNFDYAAARKLANLMGVDDAELDSIQSQRANEAATNTVNLQRLADELGTADTNTAAAIQNAIAALNGANGPKLALPPGLAPGQSRNLGPVAGTGANGNPGAADLGEIVRLPNGQYVAILGDSYTGDGAQKGTHYPSTAVPVTFDAQGKAHFGAPLTGPDNTNVLFPLPPSAIAAGANNTLPAGSITTRDGRTYMMVVGTNTDKGLAPVGGSWLVEVNNNPGGGWRPIEGSYRQWDSIPNSSKAPGEPALISNPDRPPTQISGYQANDGRVYIAADGFDRHQGVTLYSVDPDHITDRGAWQPWTGQEFGTPGQPAATISPGNFGELSLRDVEGRPILSGFNPADGNTEVRVGSGIPTGIFDTSQMTVVAGRGDWNHPVPGQSPQNYGGYIMPGATLDNMGVLVSQWNTNTGNPYEVEQFQIHPNY